ncbi:uncharacterized protein [Asterias amurensis]|uniref:uncharacterized protein n=1 Tax=Asterias amurensis TaxID=7602 RepID=UPI003AB6B01B
MVFVGLLFLVLTPCLYAEAYETCPLRNNDAQNRDMSFDKFSDHVLQGHGYSDFKGITRLKCAMKCLADTRCFSFQYTEADTGCVLNGASASRFPLSLTAANGTSYYGPEKTSFVWKLLQLASEYPGLPGMTDCTYPSPASAKSECLRFGQHLCDSSELQQAFDAGYYQVVSITNRFWYAVPSGSVIMGSRGLAYSEDLPSPVITTDDYPSTDRDAMTKACCALEAHPCTLAELKAAYLSGYRQTYDTPWLAFAVPGRDAKLFSDGCGTYSGAECYGGVVATTTRPLANLKMICCPFCRGLPGLCCPAG